MEGFYQVFTKRTTLKLSTHLSQEELREAIAKAMGMPIEEIPAFDLAAALAEIRNQSNRVNAIIKDHKTLFESNPKTTIDKYEELHDIGKFILAGGDTFKIRVPSVIPDFPDFVLIHEQHIIGIEHTRLMSQEMKAAIKTVKYYIRKANQIIAGELDHLSKTVNIFVDLNQNVIGGSNFKNKGFSGDQKAEIPQIIAEFIKSKITGGNVPKPNFITQVEITPNKDSRIDLELAERYFTQIDFSEQLLFSISKKEKRADAYRSVTNISQLWLLIVIDDVSCFSGFSIETAELPVIERSNFDAILLFEKFGGKIYPLFYKTP